MITLDQDLIEICYYLDIDPNLYKDETELRKLISQCMRNDQQETILCH
jgi:hypothetical protein